MNGSQFYRDMLSSTRLLDNIPAQVNFRIKLSLASAALTSFTVAGVYEINYRSESTQAAVLIYRLGILTVTLFMLCIATNHVAIPEI